MSREKVFVSWPGYSIDDQETGARLVKAGFEPVLRPRTGARSEDELIGMLRGCIAAIASADPFTERVMQSSPKLRTISRVGVGVDSVDMEAATRGGVAVSIAAGANAETVADHTLGFVLALLRKLVPQHLCASDGRWERIGAMTGSELPGKTVGLIGAGGIGKVVLRRLAGFDAKVIYFDEFVPSLEGATKISTLAELLEQSDVVSIHMPLVPQTHHIVDTAGIARMKPGALLINTSRGPLVDQAALFAALREGRLGGAGLDVFDEEPPPAGTFDGLPNLVLSCHVAGVSHESIRRMTISATSSALAMLAGEIPETVLNPEVLRLNPIRLPA
jgi:phosphoglycerate dehydrogenase-like enzyme